VVIAGGSAGMAILRITEAPLLCDTAFRRLCSDQLPHASPFSGGQEVGNPANTQEILAAAPFW
jgi:hypothetical protein